MQKIFFDKSQNKKVLRLEIDLENQKIIDGINEYHFEIDEFKKHCLLEGLDDIGMTLQNAKDIELFETNYKQKFPWLTKE